MGSSNKWTQEEDEILSSLLKKYGRDYQRIAIKIQGRTPTAIRYRVQNFYSGIKTGAWSIEEDQELFKKMFDLFENYGFPENNKFLNRRKTDVLKRINYFRNQIDEVFFKGETNKSKNSSFQKKRKVKNERKTDEKSVNNEQYSVKREEMIDYLKVTAEVKEVKKETSEDLFNNILSSINSKNERERKRKDDIRLKLENSPESSDIDLNVTQKQP